jgi:cathepsin B
LEGTINAYYNNPSLAPDLSEEDMITCYKANGCCGTAVNEIEILYGNYLKSGICSESCFGYSACDANTDQYHCPNQNNDGDTCTTTVSCSSKCPSTSSSWKISNYHRLALTVADLKKAIMTYGPIEVGMYLYDDFYSYRSGIYKHTAGAFRGGHAVTIVGWGTEARQNYWIAKNSWGPSWGEGGFFRIAQGDSYINSWFAFAAEQPLPVSAILRQFARMLT